MTTLRPFRCTDLFKLNQINMDPLTETYGLSFYLNYLAVWPEYFKVIESPSGQLMGYIMGKSEARHNVPTDWHGHVTALTVHPNFRRLGLAAKLMATLENTSDRRKCYFVDLFVRVSNTVAVQMYKNLGYTIYRQIVGYYSAPPGSNMENEDAYDMRRALRMDKEGKSVIPIKEPVPADEVT